MEAATANSGSNQQADSTAVWQRGGAREFVPSGQQDVAPGEHSGDLLTKEFLRKLIFYAKSKAAPVLSEDAMESISTAYGAMRNQPTENNGRRNLPVTARSLETLIRLSSAHAKLRLSDAVELQDVDAAKELVHFVLFREVSKPMVTDEADSSAGNKENLPENGKRKAAPGVSSSSGDGQKKARAGGDGGQGDGAVASATVSKGDVLRLLAEMRDELEDEAEGLSFGEVERRMAAAVQEGDLERDSLDRALEELSRENLIMVDGESIHFA